MILFIQMINVYYHYGLGGRLGRNWLFIIIGTYFQYQYLNFYDSEQYSSYEQLE